MRRGGTTQHALPSWESVIPSPCAVTCQTTPFRLSASVLGCTSCRPGQETSPTGVGPRAARSLGVVARGWRRAPSVRHQRHAPPAFPPGSEQPPLGSRRGRGRSAGSRSTPVGHAGAHAFAAEHGPHDSRAGSPVWDPPGDQASLQPPVTGPLRCCVIAPLPRHAGDSGRGISVCVSPCPARRGR